MSVEINNYQLNSSTDIPQTIEAIAQRPYEYALVHISSYILNTVMIHNLTNELEKQFSHIRIQLFKGEKDAKTNVTIYGYDALFNEYLQNSDLTIEDAALYQVQNKEMSAKDALHHSKQELLKRYFTDHLTNLPNMYQLRQDLEDNSEHTLIILSIDNFKVINDFYSFIVGDYLLEQVAITLKSLIEDGTTYRLSGSEFAIVLDETLGFYQLKDYLQDLYSKLQHLHYEYHETVIYLDITMGSITNHTGEEIFSKVSMAHQYAKKSNLSFWIYEESKNLALHYENNLKTSLNIRKAILNANIVPYFQAILDNKTDKIIAYECLSRLIDDKDQVLAPDDFMTIAKKIKVYDEVTRTIIEKSFEVFKDNDLHFTINLSIDDILSSNINTFILEKLKKDDTGKRVTFELAESNNVNDFAKISRFISEVQRHGAKIAIDNFGKGFSNFSLLASIDVDYIKIDGSLIENIDKDKNARIVVETIVSFAKRLNIQTVAEYVHTSTVMGVVKELGIDFSQGFEIDKPSPILD